MKSSDSLVKKVLLKGISPVTLIRYSRQLLHNMKNKPKEYPLKYLDNPKLTIPYRKYKNAKVIIIHDIDNQRKEKEIQATIDLEKKYNATSILMIMPFNTLDCYKGMFDNPIGLHETFPFKFEKGLKRFKENKIKLCSFSQHVSIVQTNFYPTTLDKVNSKIKYGFLHSQSFGFSRRFPLSFRPIKYRNMTLIFECSEPDKKTIDYVLKRCNKEKGVVAFNFHPDYFYNGSYFPKNSGTLEYLLKKLR